MPTIPGASSYLGSATLANTQGLAAQAPTLFGGSDVASILDAGRNISKASGVGLSGRARALNASFMNRSSDINAMFSLALGGNATLEGAQQEILAERGRLSDRQIAPSLRGTEVDTEA